MIAELTNHLWQSTVFVVLAGLLTLAFRQNRAQVRYWLWFSASFKFLVPFWVLINVGSRLGWAPAAKSVAAPAVSFAFEQIALPFSHALPAGPSGGRVHNSLDSAGCRWLVGLRICCDRADTAARLAAGARGGALQFAVGDERFCPGALFSRSTGAGRGGLLPAYFAVADGDLGTINSASIRSDSGA